MKNFWLSWWWLDADGAFELHWPWWISGWRESDEASVCAAVRAESEDAARELVLASYDKRPGNVEFRFVEERPDDWTPYNSRFKQGDWMPDWKGA